jgi:signal transduction histidine kinase
MKIDSDYKNVIYDGLTKVSKQIDMYSASQVKERQENVTALDTYRTLATLGISTLAFGHEIFPKLNSINFALIGLSNSVTTDTERKTVKKISEDCEYIQEWKGILDMYADTLSDANNPGMKKVPMSLKDLVDDLAGSLSSMAVVTDKGVSEPIKIGPLVSVGAGTHKIFTNRAAMLSIFSNLILNSIKSLMFVKRLKCPTIGIECWKEGTNLCIEFGDNGNGIAESNKEIIWKLGESTYGKRSRFRGMGIGLNIVKDTLEDQLGGTIELTHTTYDGDKKGKGKAVFLIKIPLKELKEEDTDARK